MYRILSIRLDKKTIIIIMIIALVVFIVWRLIRPMNIFIVDNRFAWPIDTSQAAVVLGNLSAKECASCHQEFYDEWQTTIHSKAWTEPYFQTDWKFDGSQHSCRLCHTPLDRQQPEKVLAYRDTDKWDPIVEVNPDFDSKLQHEGVTCAACHYRDGKIVGVLGNTNAPHPIKKIDDPNQICVRCHIVEGDRWDTFWRFPPCGTVAEIKQTRKKLLDGKIKTKGKTGEHLVSDSSSLGCVECHMPLLKRPLVEGGEVRETRQHLWRGGHDPAMVKKALAIKFTESNNKQMFTLTIENTGAAHYVPTGTPDRHLTVELRVLDRQNNVLNEDINFIKRTVMWRPFIVDLKDTRLARGQPRSYNIELAKLDTAVSVEAVVRYHLLDEKRRKRIGYENKTPIAYKVFRQKIMLNVQ
jgi:hypothetical protein